ncbi:MAG: U-box domain-containing protein [Chlamydiales bacterium]|nr:U-box domain-containing protein [Chlamydiales bacterium]
MPKVNQLTMNVGDVPVRFSVYKQKLRALNLLCLTPLYIDGPVQVNDPEQCFKALGSGRLSLQNRLLTIQPRGYGGAGGKEEEEAKIPHEYTCSITHQLMRYPVIAADGETYELEAIQKHLALHDNSPLHNVPLAHKMLTPNRALERLITTFLENTPSAAADLYLPTGKNDEDSQVLLANPKEEPQKGDDTSHCSSGSFHQQLQSLVHTVRAASESSNNTPIKPSSIQQHKFDSPPSKPTLGLSNNLDLSSEVSKPALVAASSSSAPPAVPQMAFGKAKWSQYFGGFGDIGEEPPLPADIEQILDSPCPIWPDKKVCETHLLTLIPSHIDGKYLTLRKLDEMIRRPQGGGQPIKYNYWPPYTKEFTHQKENTWVLMTREVLPNGLSSAELSKKSGLPYEVPSIVEAVTSIFMEGVKTGRELYVGHRPDRGCDYFTFTEDAYYRILQESPLGGLVTIDPRPFIRSRRPTTHFMRYLGQREIELIRLKHTSGYVIASGGSMRKFLVPS